MTTWISKSFATSECFDTLIDHEWPWLMIGKFKVAIDYLI